MRKKYFIKTRKVILKLRQSDNNVEQGVGAIFGELIDRVEGEGEK